MKFRHECKHIINITDMLQLKNRLSLFFAHDSNCELDGTYFVRSLYFDNYLDKALREKLDGVNNREKFRIRYYGDDTDFIRLEKKSKINGLCNKESYRISKQQCQDIMDGKIGFLLESDCDLSKELYAKMHYQLLAPKCIVGYRRESFVYEPGNVRITLDYNIGGSTDIQKFLAPSLPLPSLYPHAVLEVKWDEYLPQIVKDAVQMKNRQSSAFSKYALIRF